VFGADPLAAVSAPRFGTDHLIGSFNQTPPVLGNLTMDRGYAQALGAAGQAELRARGHELKLVDAPLWQPAVLARDPATGELVAAGDPKAGRKAAALG
jgi:gamma-glutamyltranspeptidase